MSSSTEGGRTFRIRTMILPAVMIGGTLVAALIVFSDLAGHSVAHAPFRPADFQDISFVASVDQPEAAAVRSALVQSCDRTGCDADVLHPMILASTDRMTELELTEALEAQQRVMSESDVTRARTSGTEEARMAELEFLTAERIGALYDAELERR